MSKKNDKNSSKVKNSVKMSSKNNGISASKTLDSIASLPKNEEEIEFKKSGVFLMAKSDAEGTKGDLLQFLKISIQIFTQKCFKGV